MIADVPSGFEGEIFGANMILKSTIQRNNTLQQDLEYRQRSFHKNKIKEHTIFGDNTNYIVLKDLKTDEVKNTFETNNQQSYDSSNTNHIQSAVPTVFDLIMSEDKAANKQKESSFEHEIYDFNKSTLLKNKKNNTIYWSLLNQPAQLNSLQRHNGLKKEPYSSGTQDLPMVSEYETPPPPNAKSSDYARKMSEGMNSKTSHLYPVNKPLPEKKKSFSRNTVSFHDLVRHRNALELQDTESPPPIKQDNKVYGQWISSHFAGSVLDYLKSIKFDARKYKKVQPTIALHKLSDVYPYASDFRPVKIRPPPEFERHKIIDHFHRTKSLRPQFNVQVVEEELKDNILLSHAQTKPKNVEVTSRGQRNQKSEHRFYRDVGKHMENENAEYTSRQHEDESDFDAIKNNKVMTILPFLKTLEYYIEDAIKPAEEKTKKSLSNSVYTKSLSDTWLINEKYMTRNHTSRHIKPDHYESISLGGLAAEANKIIPPITWKSHQDFEREKIYRFDEPAMALGKSLAKEVSDQSNINKNRGLHILMYNHGIINAKKRSSYLVNQMTNDNNNFDRPIKIGNALNERHVIGSNDKQKIRSFLGGDDKIPDINRYRSDKEDIVEKVPDSLGPRFCKNLDLYDRILYVQWDQSIDVMHIYSPLKSMNLAIEFIQQNYRRCSLEDTNVVNHPLLYIDWNRTPVRLFGGSYPKITTDLCGFF